jgi:hypothetical protein
MDEFFLFMAIGFVAQLIDGAMGMGYGAISSVALLASGVPPAHTSASVHAAKLFTTATSGISHIIHGNVDKRLFWLLGAGGVVGGVIGASLLVQLPGNAVRPYVFGYLMLLGFVIMWRGIQGVPQRAVSGKLVLPLGGTGGFLDALGGGGWGPVVTSSLIGAGAPPRFVVGTVNAAEFVVTCAIVSAFAVTLLAGHWADSKGIMEHAWAVAGLVAGGLPAALIAGWLLKKVPRRPLLIGVGALIVALSAYEISKIWT